MQKVSRIIIEAAIKNNCLLEINANGARRGKILNENNEERWIYPRLEFWKIVSNEYRNAQVIISDDAHTIKDLHDNATLGMYKFAKELNLNVVDKYFNDRFIRSFFIIRGDTILLKRTISRI